SRRTRSSWCGPVRRTSAASIPSIDVPDISPTARRDPLRRPGATVSGSPSGNLRLPAWVTRPFVGPPTVFAVIQVNYPAEIFELPSELIEAGLRDFAARRCEALPQEADSLETLLDALGGEPPGVDS